MSQKTLLVLVGPPGSGKSTMSKDYETYTYINQDKQGKGHHQLFEQAVEAGQSIIVDRMNFNKVQRAKYLVPAKAAGYKTEIFVIHENYETCLKRCLKRENHETIKDETAARSALGFFFSHYERPADDEADRVGFYYPGCDDWNTKHDTRPTAVICDLDGTLCKVDHRLHTVRPPKEWEEEIALAKKEKRKNIHGWKANWPGFFDGIPGDSVNGWCADILNSLSEKHEIVYCSGRPDNYKRVTKEWLEKNNLSKFYDPVEKELFEAPLYMRPRNDSRDDSIVKEIILDFEILTRFKPVFMIDDRRRVVDMWRRRGFTCLHCAEGEF
jgi:predicted kinase